MVVDPRTVTVQPVIGGPRINYTTPSFGETWQASAGYYLDPLYEGVRNTVRFGATPDPNFDWRASIPEGMGQYASYYGTAVNAEHAQEITRAIQESLARRETLSRAPFAQQMAAELLNPVNFVALPLGGPASAGVRGVAGAALRGGVSAAATEALLGGLAATQDPTITNAEIAMNSLFTGLFGGALSGGASIPRATRLSAQDQMLQQFSVMQRMGVIAQRYRNVDFTEVASAGGREERPFGTMEDVEQINADYESRAAVLQAQIDQLQPGSGERRLIQDELDQLRSEQRPYTQELYARALEEEGIDPTDLYRPTGTGADWLLNWVTTPMRRAYNSNWGDSVKRRFHLLAGDGGTQLNLHLAGRTDGLSVHQAAATELGQFANVHLQVMQAWANDTNAPAIGSSRLAGTDINATNLARRAQQSGDDLDSWMIEMNRRRIMGEEMNEAQAAAADQIARYYEAWEARLIETGQLRTRETLGRHISRLEDEIGALEDQLARAEAGRRTQESAETLQGVLRSRRELLDELRFEQENLPAGERTEPYNPRFFNTAAIRANRERFASILRSWYAENPEIFSYNEALRKWERVRLATDNESIERRVQQTIDNILGETEPPDMMQVFVGSGRGSNIRFRQLDIPNSRVWEFIEQNPMAVLRNYAARVTPQYHFRRTFGGKTLTQVVGEIRSEMRAAGQSEREIARAVRDFNHMYDRVVGAVLRNPESWDQRVAETLRAVTSMTYLGGAGLAALADAGRIIMETELSTLTRSLPAFFDQTIRRSSVRETRLAGASLELLLGNAGLRMVDDQNFNFLNNSRMDRIQSAFHVMNGLGPVTVFMKQFAGMNGAHMLIEYSQKVTRGDATPFERAYLARHGIDEDTAARIADAPWQTDAQSGLILPNTDEWSSFPSFVDNAGQRVRVNYGEGQVANGRYDPIVRNDDGSLTVDVDYIRDELFPNRPWTEPDRLTQSTPAIRKLRDAQRYDESPWVQAPYNLAEDAITSREQWYNFLGLRQTFLNANETFMNRQRSLLSLSNEEIVAQVGEQFRISRLVTDPEIVRDVFSRQDEVGVIGQHHYSFVDKRGVEHLGTVYLDLAGIRSFWNSVKSGGFNARAALDEINDLLVTGDIDPVAYQHERALYQNADLFENANDFAEFILLHELHHGAYRRQSELRTVGEFDFFDRITAREDIDNLLDEIADRNYDRENEQIAILLAELGYDWGRLPADTRQNIIRDMDIEVQDFAGSAELILQRTREALEYRTSIQRIDESTPEYEARIDDLALAALRDRRAQQQAQSEAANSHALLGSRGNAMPEDAFATADAYRNFLIQRTILESDPNYSFRSLGFDGRTKLGVAARNSVLNRAAMRLAEQANRTSEETLRTFRGALNTHVNNSVITASPADKPIMMDGVVYVPREIGARFGLNPDPRNPAYARVENGLLALPFQFYSYVLANVNKTVGLMMQGAVRNRLMGVVAMMAMGYMVTSIRTPDYVWDNMTPQDKFARAFDMSGVAALYSDLFYTAMQTSLAVGGPNLTGGLLQPRYPQEPSAVDAITQVTGAATGWTADMVRALATFAGGDYGEGASQFVRNLPFSNLWFLKNDVNQLGRYLSG